LKSKEFSTYNLSVDWVQQVVEMQYRVAVAYQNTAWEKGSAQLTKLFATVKQEECLRRMNLREFLVAFVQRQERLFLSIPGVHHSVLEDLIGKELTREEMEQNVQAIIQARAAKYKKVSQKLSGSAPTSGGAEDENQDLNFESPLTSDLFSTAKVVERKGTGVMMGWRTSLAIMTADAYLHFFDLDSHNVEPGASSEVAFQALMPNVIVPSSENILIGKSNFTKGWADTLTPAESVILCNCTIKPEDETSFELTENIVTTGAQKMFGKIVTKKVVVRTTTAEETDDWIEVLTSS
jgi:hypothetical protein